MIGGMVLTGKTKVLGAEPVSLPRCPPDSQRPVQKGTHACALKGG